VTSRTPAPISARIESVHAGACMHCNDRLTDPLHFDLGSFMARLCTTCAQQLIAALRQAMR